MPIRGKSKTAKDPDSALKSRRTKKTETTKTSKPTVPSGELPTDSSTPTASPQSGALPKISLPNIPFPGVTSIGGAMSRSRGASSTGVTSLGASTIAVHRRDLTNVDHGLELPQFNPNQWMAKDLFTNSSPLPETSQTAADAAVLSIARKRQTLRVVQENIALNRDTVKTATQYQGLLGDTIDYSTQLVDNQTRYIKYLDAGVKQQTAATKLSQSQELHAQENIVLAGMQAETPLIQVEWEKRIEVRKAKINALEEQKLRMNAVLQQKRLELEGLFNIAEFQTV